MPKLKAFLKGNVADYDNIKVEWHGGHKPTAYFKESADSEDSLEVILPNYDQAEVMQFFNENNFEPALLQYTGEVSNTVEFGGHYYELYKTGTPLKLARMFATEKNAYVLTIQSEDEHNFVADMLSEDMQQVWLGAAHGNENEWTWENGPEKDVMFYPPANDGDTYFTKWNEGEPNNAGGKEECATMQQSGWNDIPCDWRMSFILEYNQKPLLTESSTDMPTTNTPETEDAPSQEEGSPHSEL